jgi:hypothetical protein
MMPLHRSGKPFGLSFTVTNTTHKVWDSKRQRCLSIPLHFPWYKPTTTTPNKGWGSNQ